MSALPSGPSWNHRVAVVGYSDLDGRPGFKLTLQEVGGRFGPHNQHQPQHQPVLLEREDLVFLTYFNAGLRIVNIADARLPREVGYFVPPDPTVRRGVLPKALVAQSEDVLVDRRGYIYVTDKNHGLYVLRFEDL